MKSVNQSQTSFKNMDKRENLDTTQNSTSKSFENIDAI